MNSFLKKWLAICGVLIGNMAMGLSFSLINTNLESIQQALGASLAELQWIINIYGIFIASTLVTMGRLGDIFGRKRVYMIGSVLFAIAMLGDGLAVNPEMIIGFQAIYGLAGAILLPLSQAMLIDLYPDEKKSTAIGMWASSGGITLALGPIIGGIILEYFSWRSIFLINIPFAVLGLALTGLFARESKTEGESTKLDWPGVILLTLTIGIFILATVQCTAWNIWVVVGLFALSLLSLILLLIVEKRAEMPIIREDLFKNRMFLLCCLGNFCMIAFFWAGIFLIPLFIQKQLGFNPMQAGLLMLAFSVPIGLISPLSGHFYNKVGPRRLIFIGFILMIFSSFLQFYYSHASTPLIIALATAGLGLGISLIITPTTTGALFALSKNFAGIASGTFVTIQEIGGSMGLAVTVMIVRLQSDFAQGFQNGMLALLIISGVGLVSAILLPKRSKHTALSQTADLP